jgi:hypothetical protein
VALVYFLGPDAEAATETFNFKKFLFALVIIIANITYRRIVMEYRFPPVAIPSPVPAPTQQLHLAQHQPALQHGTAAAAPTSQPPVQFHPAHQQLSQPPQQLDSAAGVAQQHQMQQHAQQHPSTSNLISFDDTPGHHATVQLPSDQVMQDLIPDRPELGLLYKQCKQSRAASKSVGTTSFGTEQGFIFDEPAGEKIGNLDCPGDHEVLRGQAQ